MSDAGATPQAERHASWPELFFDLVAVAGVSVVAHQLEAEQPWQHIAVLAIAFAAFWILWASVTTYGNLLADRTSMVVLLASMAVLGVMVAAVPEIYGGHARSFAIAYVIGRVLMARPWKRGSVVVDMPIVQVSVGVLPWVVSIWISGDQRYIWWAVGIALDLLALLTNSGERAVESAQRRLDQLWERAEQHEERSPRKGRGRGGRAAREAGREASEGAGRGGRANRELPTTVTALRGDREHLAERMGLFVLIILGEAIIQLTVAAEASEHWNRALLVAAMGAFAFVSLLFLVAVVRGTAGLALLPAALLPARALWLGHLVVSMGLVTVGAAMGQLLEEPHEPVDHHTAAMIAIGITMFGVMSGAAHLVARAPRSRALAVAVAGPTLLAALVVALAYQSVTASALGWILAAAIFAVAWLGEFATASPQESTAAGVDGS